MLKGGKAGEDKCVLFNVCFNKDTMSVSFSPQAVMPIKSYESNPQIIDIRQIKETLNGSDEVTIENVMCGSSSSIILEFPDGEEGGICVRRDKEAPRHNGALGDLGGIINTFDPLESAVREAIEEVIIVDSKTSAVIPQFSEMPWSAYNGMIEERVSSLSAEFGITDVHFTNAEILPIKEPIYFNGREDLPISVGLANRMPDEPLTMVSVFAPPLRLRIERDSFSLWDTLGLETKGKARRRSVALVYTTGGVAEYDPVKVKEHSDFNPYVKEKFNGELKVCPTLATIFQLIGFENHPISKQNHTLTLSELIRSDRVLQHDIRPS
jgi:hypothetical protein